MKDEGAHELTDAQIEALRVQLEALKDELADQLSSHADAVKPVKLDQSAVGRVSRMDALQGQAMAQATRRSLVVQLAQCKAALQAVSKREYGCCRACEEPIGLKRLRARPESLLCLKCQRGEERR